MNDTQLVKFKRKSTNEIESLPIEDGSLIYDYETGKTYMDYHNDRIPTGGGGGTSDIVMVNEEPTEDTKLLIESEDLDFQGSEIVDEHSESNKVGYSASYSNKAFGGTILWTNPNPTSSFSSQTITLNSSDYDCYEIIFSSNNQNSSNLSTGKVLKGKNTYLTTRANIGNNNVYRDVVYISDTQLKFNDGYVDTTANSDQAIPQYVIGYKTGLFS